MSGAFGVTSGERVAEEVRRAGALGTVVACVAVRVLAANYLHSTFKKLFRIIEVKAILKFMLEKNIKVLILIMCGCLTIIKDCLIFNITLHNVIFLGRNWNLS